MVIGELNPAPSFKTVTCAQKRRQKTAYICYFVFPFEIRLFHLEVSKKVWYSVANGNGNIEYGLNCVFAGKKEKYKGKQKRQ